MGRRNDSSKITFPAGHMNRNESPRDAAIREMFEETGLKIKDFKTIAIKIPKPGSIIHIFEVEVSGDPTNKNDPDKEFSELWYGDPKSVSDKDWHIPVEHNLGLKALYGKK